MSDVHSPIRPFYLTLPSVCPYLADRVEQRVVAELRPSADERMFDELSEVGFRRSQGWMYRPACPGCQACIPVRIPVADFNWTRAWRKIVNRNADLTFEELPARFHAEHYDLFRRYIASRHGDGGMAKMTDADYREMVDTGIERTMLVSFRDARGVLKAVSLTDRLLCSSVWIMRRCRRWMFSFSAASLLP